MVESANSRRKMNMGRLYPLTKRQVGATLDPRSIFPAQGNSATGLIIVWRKQVSQGHMRVSAWVNKAILRTQGTPPTGWGKGPAQQPPGSQPAGLGWAANTPVGNPDWSIRQLFFDRRMLDTSPEGVEKVPDWDIF